MEVIPLTDEQREVLLAAFAGIRTQSSRPVSIAPPTAPQKAA